MDPVIKKQDVDDRLAAGKFNFNSFERDAQRIMDGARQDAQAQMYKAQQEINKMRAEIRGEEFGQARKQGYDQGFEEGKKEGLEAGRKEAYDQHLKELTEATAGVEPMLSALYEEINDRRHAMIEEAERDMLSLSFAVGERLTRLRIETDPNIVRETLRAALDLVLNRSSLDIFVCTADLEAISSHLPALRRQMGDIGDLRLHSDEDIAQGSVEVRTARGRVSISIDKQLDRIARELLGISADDALEQVGAYGKDESAPQAPSKGNATRILEQVETSNPMSQTNPVSIDELSKDKSKSQRNTAEIVRDRLKDAETLEPQSIDDVARDHEGHDRLTRMIKHVEANSTDDVARKAMQEAEKTSDRLMSSLTSHSDLKKLSNDGQGDEEEPATLDANEMAAGSASDAQAPSAPVNIDEMVGAHDADVAAKAEAAEPEPKSTADSRAFDVNQGVGGMSLDSVLADIDAAADEEERHHEEEGH